MATKHKPLISIIGRPNVGKSTLINRLAGRRACIVNDEPGVTRDRKYIDVNWEGVDFTAVDTGGLVFDESQVFSREILEQAMQGVNVSDGVIFVVDALAGVTKLDAEVADFLRKNVKVPIYLAANKVDNIQRHDLIYDFYELGFENIFPISAIHGSQGLGDLLSTITDGFKQATEEESDLDEIKVSIVGKPNVGKSSLFNKLLGEERSIVSEVSGTTRDAIDTILNRHGNKFRLIDTAGLRRKAKVKEDTEKFSNLRAIKAIEDCDVAVLIIDVTEGALNSGNLNDSEHQEKVALEQFEHCASEQDKKVAGLITDRGKACVILLNKWDLIENKDDRDALKKFKDKLNYELRFLGWAPKDFISVKTGQRTDKIWQMIVDVNEQHKRRISTSFLNKMVSEITTLTPPPVVKQKAIKIKYVSQVGTAPPTFAFFVNYPELVPETYKRFLERQLREYFGFEGTPIFVKFKLSS